MSANTLYGPKVQHTDGTVVPGKPLDLEHILADFVRLDAGDRAAVLSILAHDLTVGIRSILFDPPVSESGIECAKWMNEALHRLTACVNPRHRWSVDDEVSLIRRIVESSFRHKFEFWVGAALNSAKNAVLSKPSIPAE